jgi:glycosyltransferase involved in cell wall biosynthesis
MTKVVFIQFGNYAEAYERLAAGGEETYFAQRASVEAVGELARRVDEVCVLCVNQSAQERVVANGVRTLGIPVYAPERADVANLLGAVERQAATHVVLCVPMVPVLRWAAARRLRVLAILADSFLGKGPKQWYRRRRLVRALNRRNVEWVGNHNTNASLHLSELGVAPSKIIPWDWPAVVTPDDYPAKTGRSPDGPFRLIYVGALSEEKGTGDCIRAVAELARRGRSVSLSVGGGGAVAQLQALARELGVEHAVQLLGHVPHSRVLDLMHEHDAVLVPSRHVYSEALPMTIYESYCARTPLIASDHPMFRGKVIDGVSGLVFPASDSNALADKVEWLADNSALFKRLSENTREAWAGLQCPVKHRDLYTRWLSDNADDRRWLAAHSLASGLYSSNKNGASLTRYKEHAAHATNTVTSIKHGY